MKTILLINWVTISRKQLYQLKAINECGFSTKVFTNDILGDSEYWVSRVGPNTEFIRQPATLFARIHNLVKKISNLRSIKCAILAPEGRYSLVVLILLKLIKVKIICVEWGGIANINKLPLILKIIMNLCYKYSDLIWFKEPYMQPLLLNKTSKPLFFLPNAVESLQLEMPNFFERHNAFIWANRLVHGRHPDWYVNAANDVYHCTGQQSILMGFLDKTADYVIQEQCKTLASDGVRLMKFGNPHIFFPKSRYFVLAADQVFGNNSLLEAMTYGTVPIVTRSIGIDKIIIDGENGIIAENTELGLYLAMKKASIMSEPVWNRLSQNAVKTVTSKFAATDWKNGFAQMLTALERECDF